MFKAWDISPHAEIFHNNDKHWIYILFLFSIVSSTARLLPYGYLYIESYLHRNYYLHNIIKFYTSNFFKNTYNILDSERSDECVDFKMKYNN